MDEEVLEVIRKETGKEGNDVEERIQKENKMKVKDSERGIKKRTEAGLTIQKKSENKMKKIVGREREN